MKTLSRSRLTGADGAFTAITGALLLAAIVIPADPLGRLVGAFIGASFLAGLVGAFVREALARRDHVRRAAQRKLLLERCAPAPAVTATPLVVDPTASEFDDDKRPAFAPVVSLTEAQVERRRVERQRQHRHATLTKA
jgi:hypothetical protein